MTVRLLGAFMFVFAFASDYWVEKWVKPEFRWKAGNWATYLLLAFAFVLLAWRD